MAKYTVSEQIKQIQDHYYDYFDLENVKLRDSLYREAYEEYNDMPHPIKQAKAMERFMTKKNIKVFPFDILAGQMQQYVVSSSLPVFGADLETFDPTHIDMALDNCTKDTEVEIARTRVHNKALSAQDEQDLDLFMNGVGVSLYSHWTPGHVVIGYNNIVPIGLGEILARIEASKQRPNRTRDELDYLEGMRLVVEALKAYMLRYADAAHEAIAQAENAEQTENLKRIEAALRKLTVAPPDTFFEAVQFVTIFQEAVTFEHIISMSPGRLDQIWYPYYKKDKEAGRITREEARDMIDAFRLKLAGAINTYQSVTLGGVDEEGNLADNEVTSIFLESTTAVRYDQPLLSFRYNKGLSDEAFEDVLSVVELGDGFPGIFNDDITIQSFVNHGVSLKDARNYSVVGCVETTASGQEFTFVEEMRINWVKVLELMFTGGTCTVHGNEFTLGGDRNIEKIGSLEELIDWWKEEYEYFLRRGTNACNLITQQYYKDFPAPLLSTTIEDCIGNASDATWLGPKYRYSAVLNTGMANVVDSFLAIKKLVYDEKRLTLQEFASIVNKNYEGQEDLRNYILNKCEKFGNDDAASNKLMQELVNWASELITGIPNAKGFHFVPGYYSARLHMTMGMHTGASPDGRLAKETLANGMCPAQGADKIGPTAVINAVTSPSHSLIRDGMVLDLKFSPSFFKQPEKRKMFRSLLDAYFDKGGMQVQFNVVDRETLLKAQQNPEDYKNLIVRISGFSAYFTCLFKELQDEIISRTEYDSI